MCTAVEPGLGSGWESHIARLIHKANDTLSTSAYRRQFVDGERTLLSTHVGHLTSTRNHFPLRACAPKTFRGDRSASYRCRSEGWDASCWSRNHGTGGINKYAPPVPSPPYSSHVAARVDRARTDGMEERIRLEVQAHVSQRVSLAERAAEAAKQRADGLAEEVSNLGEIVRRSNASTTTALEQLLAGEQRSRSAVTLLETWRADHQGWCARTDDSLTSLAEDSRALARRAHAQQKVLDEVVIAQEDLASSVKSSRKIGEAASASAVAPIREHFLKEIETIRRRLLDLEVKAQRRAMTVGPDVIPPQLIDLAREEASAKAEEVWRKVKTHLRENLAEEAERDAHAATADRKRLELRLAEVEQRVDAHGFTLETLQQAQRETLRESNKQSEQAAKAAAARDAMTTLEMRLADGLARINEELRDMRSRENRHAAAANAAAAVAEAAAAPVAAPAAADGPKVAESSPPDTLAWEKDLRPILQRLEELEGLRERPFPADQPLTTATAPSPASAEMVERIDAKVQDLVSGAGMISRRQTTLENSLEEVNETLSGHTLKLRCLEGLWRQVGSQEGDGAAAEGAVNSSSSSSSSNRSGSGSSNGSGRGRRDSNETSNTGACARAPNSSSIGEGGHPSASTATAPARRAGFAGLLKRLGSNPLSSSQKEVAGTGVSGGEQGTQGSSRASSESGRSTPRSDPTPGSVSDVQAGDGASAAAVEAARSDKRAESNTVKSSDADQQRVTESAPVGERKESRESRSGSGRSNDDNDSGGKPRKRSAYSGADDSSGEGEGGGALQDTRIPNAATAGRKAESAPSLEAEPGGQQVEPSHQQQRRANCNAVNLDPVPQEETPRANERPTDEPPPAATTIVTASSTVTAQRTDAATTEMVKATVREGVGALDDVDLGAAAAGRASAAAVPAERRTARELEESCGSLEGDSAHSRWSLTLGAHAGGVYEQRTVWAGGQEDDSVGSAEQAPSSIESGRNGRGRDSKSPSRSRVESYDLQQETGEAFMVTFSPDRSSAASPEGCPDKTEKLEASTAPKTVSTPAAAAPNDVGSASTAATPVTPGAADWTPDASPSAASGSRDDGGDASVARDAAEKREFFFSDDDETEGEELGDILRGTTKFDGRHGGVGEGEAQAERGGRDSSTSDRARGVDSREGSAGEGVGDTAEGQKRRPRADACGSDDAGENESTPAPGGHRGVVDSACATPAPGAWAAPNFGFSSDEDFDVELSSTSSERSLGQSVERSWSRSPEIGVDLREKGGGP